MATGDASVQQTVYSLEQGPLALVIKTAMFAAAIIALVLLYLFVHFKGLSDAMAMDQAQIARNIAAGKGFTTNNVSPLMLQRLKDARKVGVDGAAVDLSRLPDIYHMPLGPWVNSFALRLVRAHWDMDPKEIIYAGDRIIAFTSMLFLLLGVGVWYFVFVRLFDAKLALFACAAILLTDLLWQFSLSGLPQMLLLLLFGVATLLTLLAEEAQERAEFVPSIILLVAAGLVFGLMILTHGLALWIFAGWIVYTGVVLRPRGLLAAAALAAAMIVVVPWLVRNFQVSGNALPLSILGAFHDGPPETGYLRYTTPGLGLDLKGVFRRGITAQLGSLPSYLGLNFAALAFFPAILHRFRNPLTARFRWGLTLMWLLALLGMCFYRPFSDVSANQLHIIFLPIFVCYGFAFFLVLWGRWEFGEGLLRTAYITGIILASGAPLIMTLLAGPAGRVHWPPYVPPFIAILNDWFNENETVASDMPWAVAWYADRKSLLLPESLREFNRIHDYGEFRQPLRGLYLTPVSGNAPLFTEIYKGRYREWAPLILRPPDVRGFPFAFYAALPIEGECIIFSDSERWTRPREVQ